MSLLTPSAARDAWSVRRLSFGEAEFLRSFLRTDIAANSFGLGWLHECDVLPLDPNQRFQFLAAVNDDAIGGVALLAGTTVACVYTNDRSAAAALGLFHRRISARLQTVIGPREMVRSFWSEYARGSAVAPLWRDQTLLELRARDLRYFVEPLLEIAEPDDLDELYAMSLAMHEEEVGLALPSHERDLFRRNVRARIDTGRLWLLRDPLSGHITFKASVSTWSPDVAQVEGVYVPPWARKGGVARRALSEMLRRVFGDVDRVTLYTDDANTAALRLYTRLGFRSVAPWATIYAATPPG